MAISSKHASPGIDALMSRYEKAALDLEEVKHSLPQATHWEPIVVLQHLQTRETLFLNEYSQVRKLEPEWIFLGSWNGVDELEDALAKALRILMDHEADHWDPELLLGPVRMACKFDLGEDDTAKGCWNISPTHAQAQMASAISAYLYRARRDKGFEIKEPLIEIGCYMNAILEDANARNEHQLDLLETVHYGLRKLRFLEREFVRPGLQQPGFRARNFLPLLVRRIARLLGFKK